VNDAQGSSTIGNSQPPPPRPAELSVVVACHTLVCAISSRFVSRLVLNADIDGPVDRPGGVIRCGGDRFASFNLGSMLGLPPLTTAWALLGIPHPQGTVSIALRTGTCLFVRHVDIDAPLPPGLFASREAAMIGAFVAGTRYGLDESLAYGLVLDPEQLWSDAELDAARTTLRQSNVQV
jgi:hypothetical protein